MNVKKLAERFFNGRSNEQQIARMMQLEAEEYGNHTQLLAKWEALCKLVPFDPGTLEKLLCTTR